MEIDARLDAVLPAAILAYCPVHLGSVDTTTQLMILTDIMLPRVQPPTQLEVVSRQTSPTRGAAHVASFS
jgi:hypothetical protein